MIKFLILAFLKFALAQQVLVPGGKFQPLFQDKGEAEVSIKPLSVDTYPVTNEQYLEFVKKNPRWQKSNIAPMMADSGYLNKWTTDMAFPSSIAKYPVVQVSWFAARAYCKDQGERLPTILEWEYFSDAQNPIYEQATLKWYAQGQDKMRKVGQEAANKFGIHDTSGLIWEWVDDFSSAIMSGDSREGVKRDMFCGGASLGSKNPKMYAAFMRYALRSSLNARYSTSSLGFRCVKDVKEKK